MNNIKVSVIGGGHWGKNLIKTFFELGALHSVVEMSEELRNGISANYKNIPVSSNYKEILESNVPAIAIATPAHTHFGIAKDALQAGKHVFVEKPITLSSEGAQELIQIAEEQNKILMVGHLLLYQPAVRAIKEAVNNGCIGELRSIHQERLKLGRVRSVENVLWSFGVHDLAVFLYLTGSKPIDLHVNGQKIVQDNIEDDVFLHLTFPNNVSAHLHTSWLWPVQKRQLILIGTKGMIVYDEDQQTVTLFDKGINPHDLTNREAGEEVLHCGNKQPLTLECQHFLECVSNNVKPLSDGQNGLDVVRVLEEASRLLNTK